MVNIYDPRYDKYIVKHIEKKEYFDSKNKFFYLNKIDDKYDISYLSLDFIKNKLNHSQRMKILESSIDLLSYDEIHEIALNFAFYSSTDNLIDCLRILKYVDPYHKSDIKLFFKEITYYTNNINNIKNVNIFECAIYGRKYTTIDYLINKYNFRFWNDFLELVHNRYGNNFSIPFKIFNKGIPNYSYKIDRPNIISLPIIDKLFKNKLEKAVIELYKANFSVSYFGNLFKSIVAKSKYYMLRELYESNLHKLIDVDEFKNILLTINLQIFDFNKNFNSKNVSRNICGIFRILMKYFNEYLSINELKEVFNDRDFLTSVAGFQNGVEIFKLIDKYIVDYNYRDESGYKLIDDAAKYGSLATFKFLEKRTNFNEGDDFNLIDYCDSIYNVCFYNSNLDLIEYIFNKFSLDENTLKNIYFDRTFQIIYGRPKKLEKIKIIAKVINIKSYLPLILSRWNGITINEINQLIKLSIQSSSKNLYDVCYSSRFIYYPHDVTIPPVVFKSNNFTCFRKLLDLYSFDDELLLNAFSRVISYKCIQSKWVKEFDKYFTCKRDYLIHYKLFNKEEEFSFTESNKETYFDCLIDTFNILRKELGEESYEKLKSNMDQRVYDGCALNYLNFPWSVDNFDKWNNPEFLRFYFLTCVKVNYSFLKNITREEYKSIRGWFLLHKYLRRISRRINKKKLDAHKALFRPLINMLEYEPNMDSSGLNKNIGRKFKISLRNSMDRKINNPIHLKPEHLISNDLANFDYYLSEKADGVIRLLDLRSTKMFPKFPKKYKGTVKSEFIEKLNIHFIFGIEDDDIDDFEFINDISTSKDISKNMIVESFSDISKLCKDEKEKIQNLRNNMIDHSHSKNTVFWFPKKIFKVFGRNLLYLLADITDNQTNLFPTDGWIFWKSLKHLDCLEDLTYYKMKPLSHLTVDLEYIEDNIMRDFDKNKYTVFKGDQKLERSKIYRCYYDNEKMMWCPRENEMRIDKKNPNNKDIVKYLTESHTCYKWCVSDIIKIKDVDYYTKGSFEKTKLSNDYKKLLGNVSNESILDLGCGYSPLKREFNKYLGKNKYIGLDSDFNVFNLNSSKNEVLWYDFNKRGLERWGNLYNYFVDGKCIDRVLNAKYDNIFIVNSIHYFEEDNIFKMIKRVSKTGTKVYIKYLCKELFEEKFSDFKGYVDNNDNWVLKKGDEIEIFYSWVHKKPHTEKLVSGKKLIEGFEKIGFKKKHSGGDLENIIYKDYDVGWNRYMECFIFEEYVCL